MLYGEIALPIAGVMVAISQVFYNMSTVYLYERAIGNRGDLKKTLIDVCKSPMFVGASMGLIINFLNVNLYFLEQPLRDLGNLAPSLALIVLGTSVDFKLDRENLKNTLIVTFSKLILSPLLAFGISKAFSLSPMELGTVVVLFGAPTAVASFTFAKEYNADTNLGQSYVLSTMIFYMFTIYLVKVLV